jgi:hypothetical protein
MALNGAYRQTIQPPMKKNVVLDKFGYRPDEAAFALGSEKLFQECVQAAWLKPIIKRHKLTLYAQRDIARCWARILAGELPPQTEALTRYEIRKAGAR